MEYKQPQIWKRIVCIMMFSLLSIALFGSAYWFAKEYVSLKFLRTSWTVASGFVWGLGTAFLLRKSFRFVKEDGSMGTQPRQSVFFMLALAVGCGSVDMGDYVHRLTSSYQHCKRLTKESIAMAEYVKVDEDYQVMTNCVGFDVGSRHDRKGFNITYRALVVAPVKDSHGVYLAGEVDGGTYQTGWKSAYEMDEDYHDARQRLRHKIPEHDYGKHCRTFRRIFPYNTDNYGEYLNAVDHSAELLRDSAFCAAAFPAILWPIKDETYGPHAQPMGFFFAFSLLFFTIACVVMIVAHE